jgi:uncharacterized repeat protein (TIGR03943 family)
MRSRDAGILVGLIGVLALRVSLTDDILLFLRPGMRPWLTAAGAVLLAAGVLVAVADFRARRRVGVGGAGVASPDGGHSHRPSRVGWLLVAPLVIGVVVAPGALGAYAAGRQGSLRSLPTSDFDLDAYLRAQRVSGQDARLPVSDYLTAAGDEHERALLAASKVRLVGFVAPKRDAPAGEFYLTRFLIGCCAGDAIAMQIEVRSAHETPPTDSWVEVTAMLLPDASPPPDRVAAGYPPVVAAATVERADAPSEPYEYPAR